MPGVVQTDLLAAGVIERPYYRDNESKYAWVGREDWVYAREFDLPAEVLAHRRHVLVCEGLDTFAEVTLNGVSLGRDGEHVPPVRVRRDGGAARGAERAHGRLRLAAAQG